MKRYEMPVVWRVRQGLLLSTTDFVAGRQGEGAEEGRQGEKEGWRQQVEGDGAEAGKADESGTKSEHYWAHWTSAYHGKPPSTYLLSCTCIHALRRSTFSSTPSFYWSHPSFYWKFWYSP